MEFKLYFQSNGPLVLPLAYHHILQGFIYKRLSEDPEFSDFLHNEGYKREGQSFRLFVFSLLKGHFKIVGSNIVFDNVIEWEIRSPIMLFCQTLFKALEKEEVFDLAGQKIFLLRYEVLNTEVVEDEIDIRMLSPVCVDLSIWEDGKSKTKNLDPIDPRFNYYLTKNFQRKFEAVTGEDTDSGIFLLPPENFEPSKNKYVTRFVDGIYVTGWKGQYKLKGSPNNLKFLYDTGLGARNSQGFGMFQIV